MHVDIINLHVNKIILHVDIIFLYVDIHVNKLHVRAEMCQHKNSLNLE